MSTVADRGLPVRLPVRPGGFASADAEAFAEAGAALRAEVMEARNRPTLGVAALRTGLMADTGRLAAGIGPISRRLDARTDKPLVRLGGSIFVPMGLMFAAPRLT